jgi:hypothetical protein
MVVFGRPKGKRGSYLQWKEDNVAPQVVFEVVSPGNTQAELMEKIDFYDEHGVEEFYIYDPDRKTLRGFRRQGQEWSAIPNMLGWVSPRLKIRFDLEDGQLVLQGPDGRRFVSYVELVRQRQQAEAQAQQERDCANQERQRANQERQRANQERQRANQERQRANQERQRAEQERQRAEQAQTQAERLAEKLRALGIDPNTV